MQQAFLWLLFTPLGKAVLLWGTTGTLPKQSPQLSTGLLPAQNSPEPHRLGEWQVEKVASIHVLSFHWGGNMSILLMCWQC